MTTMVMVLLGLLGLACVIASCSAALIMVIIWVGRGEPDVNGDPERDADPHEPNGLPPWDADVSCSICGVLLTPHQVEDARLLSSGSMYFKMCDKCRVEAEEEINAAAHARRATMEVK